MRLRTIGVVFGHSSGPKLQRFSGAMRGTLIHIAHSFGLPTGAVAALLGVAAVLAAGSLARFILLLLRRASPEKRRQRLGSLIVWWVMLAVLVGIMLVGQTLAAVVFGILSVIALYEYFGLLEQKKLDPRAKGFVYLSVPLMYGSIAAGYSLEWQAALFVAVAAFLSVRLILAHTTAGYLSATGSLIWGLTWFVFALAHGAMIVTLPTSSNPVAGAAGWLLYLVIVTESLDIFQALWGRKLGRHKITPVVSPKKTWEGFVLGSLSAVLIGIVLAPLLTPLAAPTRLRMGTWSLQVPYFGAVCACLWISVCGFLGDLNISALKRDIGVKDSANWIPGQGGILDRIDSLIFTAPAFYYFIRVCYSA